MRFTLAIKSFVVGILYNVLMGIYYIMILVAASKLDVCKCDPKIEPSCGSNKRINILYNVMKIQGTFGLVIMLFTCVTGCIVEEARYLYMDADPKHSKRNKENFQHVRYLAVFMSIVHILFIFITSIIIWVYINNDKNLEQCVNNAEWPVMYAIYITMSVCVVTAAVYIIKYILYRQTYQVI